MRLINGAISVNGPGGAGSFLLELHNGGAQITTANSNPVLKTIRFNITGACPRTLTLLSPLPALTRPVIIDGYTQPGSSPNSDSRTFDGTLCIVLVGANTISNGLHFQTQVVADEMTVKGLIFYGFNSEAIRISGAGKGFVSGNLFGTGSNLIQTFADTVIRAENAPDSVIGGLSDEARNVIGLGQIAGTRLNSSSERRQVVNNFIGLGANGTYTIALYLSTQCLAPNFAEGGDDIARSAPISLTCATASTNCTQAVTIPVDTSLTARDFYGNTRIIG